MQLSRLEIKGFKSFGDKVTLQFDKGVSGIVGPNGCGKSNVVDAIRWVLGEQKTRNLRSDKMKNVIFNGSKNRKPVQLAEVTITFDNTRGLLPTAYSSVSITRRYYRTGDSEYLLNGVACRLKDITDLFLDTGIGPDSYAIIELRMVDELLNDKENARRLLFEEAAGVSKFRVRRRQTLKKLEETDADLTRVEDVLAELQRNLKSLERQAKVSQRFARLREEYRTVSMVFARRSIAHHSEALARLQQQLAQETTRRQTFAREAFDLERALDGLQKAAEAAREALDQQRTATAEAGFRLRERETGQQQRRQRLTQLEERARTLRQALAQDAAQGEQIARDLTSLAERLTVAEADLAAVRAATTDARAALDVAQQQRAAAQQAQQTAAQQQRTAQQGVFQQQKDAEIAALHVQTGRRERQQVLDRQQADADATARGTEELARAEAALASATARLNELQEAERQRQESLAEAETRLQALLPELANATRELDARRNQLHLTRSLVENLEGFPEASRFLYKAAQSGRWNAQAPLLSDVLSCPPEYKAAISAYLEPWLPCFVVDSADDALAAVALLQKENKGRAGFLISSEAPAVSPSPVDPLAQSVRARTVVSASDARYDPLLDWLLRDVYLTDASLESLPADPSRTWLLRDGSAVRRPGGVTGGTVGAFTGSRLGRKQELDTLSAEVTTLGEQVKTRQAAADTTRQQVGALRAAARLADIRQAEQAVQQAARAHQAAQVRGEQAVLNRQRAEQQLAELSQRISDLEARAAALQPAADAAKAALATADQAAARATRALDTATQAAAERSAEFNQLNIRQHQLQNQVSSIQQEMAYKRSSAEAAARRAEQQRTELAQGEAEVTDLRAALAQDEAALTELSSARDQAQQQLTDAETSYLKARGNVEEAERQRRDRERQRGLADEVTRQLAEKVSETKMNLVAVRERLTIEFGLHLGEDDTIPEEEGAAQEGDLAEFSLDDLNRRVLDIRKRIDALGPVNPLAHEAYEELRQRDEFIRTQRDDLLEARSTLLKTIGEIDTVAKEKYLAAFNQIKEHFGRVFCSLFHEGDTCDLVIVDAQNPLESRIEILARPKGKRPLTINQLSGGEKTLTAVALLFAIYLLKPAPFCIFDEVDAPLDDANIDKFNQIIKEFSATSQFIIVTHNKRTMASTDVLYGITMTEPGVSRALPVDLRTVAA